ncbi:guanylate cyclase domain-containing protein, partial [Haematococcus lacustris]
SMLTGHHHGAPQPIGCCLPLGVLAAYVGDHQLDDDSTVSGAASRHPHAGALQPMQPSLLGMRARFLGAKPIWPLYQLVPERAFARLAHLLPPVTFRTVRCGVSDAPVGHVALAFIYVQGAQQLLAEVSLLARDALEALQRLCLAEALPRGGYVVECADGYILAAFPRPADALAWGLACRRALREYEGWDPELLQHPLCAPVFAE